MDIRLTQKTVGTIEFSALAIPRKGLSVEQAKDLWLEASPDNCILDFGDSKQNILLVAQEKFKTVLYEVCPELCPPGFTVQMAMEHMRKAGWDVRGEGPTSADGNPTVIVAERYK